MPQSVKFFRYAIPTLSSRHWHHNRLQSGPDGFTGLWHYFRYACLADSVGESDSLIRIPSYQVPINKKGKQDRI